jgi:signal transduction histidine kinase
MGGTGESYLVGEDMRMRSVSRFFPSKLPRSISVRLTKLGLPDTLDDNHIITDYRGERVVSYYRKLSTPLLGWTLISEIDFNEAMKPIIQLRNYLLLITLGLSVIIIVSTVFISNVISQPILYLKDVIISLSKGIIPDQKLHVDNRDEIGQIAEAISQLIASLKRTTDFAHEIGSGNFNTSFTTLGNSDTLGLTLIQMRDELKNLNEREIRLVREKAGALLEGQENERKRIIQELHDGVGQLLTVAQLRVEMLENEPALRKEIMGLINDTIAEVRRISYNVMPNAIVDFGLEAALKGLCENSRKYTSLSFDFQYVREVDRALSFEVTIAVFRIVQEGINNIIKHAKATQVEVYVLDKGDEIYVLLKDDGQGFNEEQVLQKNGFGLRSMRERATLLNGNMEIHSNPGKGTTIEVDIPIDKIE